MRSKMFAKIIFVFLTIILGNYLLAQSISKAGTTAGSFLEISVGARAQGMGGAFVGVANDASALYWNPGGISSLTQYEVVLTHTNWIADTKFDYAGLVIPLEDFGTLGLSFTSLSMEDMKVRTVEKPEGTGEYFSAGDIAVGITYARNLTDRFLIGFTGKFIQQKIWHETATAFAIDAGTVFRTDLFGGMVIGASILNFGTSMKMDGRDSRYFIRLDASKLGSNDQIPTEIELDSWDLPLIFQIGISIDVINSADYKLKVATDAVHPSNDYESMNVGTEFSFKDFLHLRGGYQSLWLKDTEGGLSLGVGVNSKLLFSQVIVNFDYAYRDFGRLQNIHNLTVGLKF